MKRINFKKIVPVICLAVMILAVSTRVAEASIWDKLGVWDLFWALFSNLMQAILTITAWLVGLTGTLLNVSVFLTTHLGAFVNDTPVIYTVWGIIRDLASMALIFIILWAAIQMILGLKQPNYGDLIKSIIIMGILVNFSFFFARVLIDASNIVSLQFYNAIAPGKEYVSGSGISDWTLSGFRDGGLSNILMGSLKVNEWYQNRGVVGSAPGNAASDANAAPIRIVLVTAGGIIVMVFAAISFLGAAVACILRLAMLVFLLAFSPIWIAAKAMPQLKEAADPWWKQFKIQLFFLPVYLMFMYVAIRILTESNLKNLTGGNGILWNTGDISAYTTLFVGFAIVIIMINIPLIAAISVAGAGGSMTEKWFKGAQSWLGRRTVGRAAYTVNESRPMRWLTSASPTIGSFASKQVSKMSSAGFGGKKGGYEADLKAKKSAEEAMHKRLGTIDKSSYRNKSDLEKAEARAKIQQEKYRQNLPWGRNSVLGFMLGNRAHLQAQYELNKKAADQAKKEDAKKARSEKKEISKERAMDLSKERIEELKRLGPEGEAILKRREARIAQLDERERELDEIIEKGKAIEDEERESKISGKLEDLEKKIGESGGGGGEKPKTT